jgi:hypothetical protein
MVYLLPKESEFVLHGVVGDVALVGQLLDLLVHRPDLTIFKIDIFFSHGKQMP